MKRWWIYIVLYLVVGLFGFSPFQATDIATLCPVELVWLERDNGLVRIETDGENVGIGATAAEALENMKATASGMIFLDTADYLIVKAGDEALVSQMSEILRPSCSLCTAQSKPDLKETVDFLGIHEPTLKLKDIDTKQQQMQLLRETEGRLELIGR